MGDSFLRWVGTELGDDALKRINSLYSEASDRLGFDVLRLCRESSAQTLEKTVYSQPAIFVSSYAAAMAMELAGKYANCRPITAVMGLSLGEYTALCFANCISFSDAVALVQRRAEAMQLASDMRRGAMYALSSMTVPEVDALCKEAEEHFRSKFIATNLEPVCVIGNFLADGQNVISGDHDVCAWAAAEASRRRGIATTQLAVSGAFHSALMKPAQQQLSKAIDDMGIVFRRPSIPVIANVDAKPYAHNGDGHGDMHDADQQSVHNEIKSKLIRQLVEPVLWSQCMHSMTKSPDHELSVEAGPGNVLKGILLKHYSRRLKVISVSA